MAIILVAAEATTVARIGARAPAYQALRPLASTSSTLCSRQGIDHLLTSLSTLGRQTPGFGLKTIGLPIKPMVADNKVIIIHTTGLIDKPIVFKPKPGVCLPRVLRDISRWSIPWRECSVEDVPAEGLRAW